MKSTTPKEPITAKVDVEHPKSLSFNGEKYAHIRISICGNFGLGISCLWINCQIDETTAKRKESYAWRLEAPDGTRSSLYDLKEKVAVLSKIQRKVDKLVAKNGRWSTFDEFVTVHFNAIGVDVVKYRDNNYAVPEFRETLRYLEDSLFRELNPEPKEVQS